eukprot:TRINITY_DN2609_c0_g1_i1.p1 TRINITY_DN2609_c0_g1~~TRINITY_DN2609_c0_g1_i1.p1  ORF type:complete len:218 (-),score=40.54 TRINITY_DN2609_c0_g1_i1:155-808(-)
MMRRPPRSTLSSSSAASDVYKRQDNVQSNEEMVFVMDGPPSNPCVVISVPSGLADKEQGNAQVVEVAAEPTPCRRRRCRVFLGLMLFFGALFVIHHNKLHHRCHKHLKESFGYESTSSHGAGSSHHNHHNRHVIETPIFEIPEVGTPILREERPFKKDPILHEERPKKADPVESAILPEGRTWMKEIRDRVNAHMHHIEKKVAEVTEEERPVRPLRR